MWDALTATPYVYTLANYLSGGASPQWTVIHPLLSSSARQFGISSLDRDVEDIASAIAYIRATPALGSASSRIVLMGHSTGCQDGAILQAPVSDRDSILHSIATSPAARDAADECNRIAAATPPDQHTGTLLPLHATRPFFGSVPVLISRWLSLASPLSPDHPADDDKFSFDLAPACVVPTVDQAVLLDRWKRVVEASAASGGGAAAAAELNPASGLIAGAKHNLAGDLFAQRWARQVDLPERVMRYLDEVVAGRSSNANPAEPPVGQGL
ncbi:hypothetical protein DV736_g5569, partial [Chaetothyriales sp. CBS 134916]